MKKKTKIFLVVSASILVVALVTSGVIIAAKKTSGDSISGSMLDRTRDSSTGRVTIDGTEIVEGTGEYDWCKVSVNISCREHDDPDKAYLPLDNERLYINGHYWTFGWRQNYINQIWFWVGTYEQWIQIEYYPCFSSADNFQAFFVFDNGYISKINTIYGWWDMFRGDGGLYITKEEIKTMKAEGRDILNSNLIEIWARVID